jgi:hypothetical protein
MVQVPPPTAVDPGVESVALFTAPRSSKFVALHVGSDATVTGPQVGTHWQKFPA